MSVLLNVRGNLGSSFNLRPVNNPNNEKPSMVLNFSVASSTFKRNAEGKNEVTSTEWIECEYWNRNADHLHKILKTGTPVFLVGEERFETYTNKEGIEVRARKLRVTDLYIVPTQRIESFVLAAPKSTGTAGEAVEIHDDDIPY